MMNQKPKIIICDLDGTVCDITHRLYFIKKGDKQDWDAFYEACNLDKPNIKMQMILLMLKKQGFAINYVSGRSEVVRVKTLEWLNLYGFPHGQLFMRPASDTRPDDILKKEILDTKINIDKVWLVFDDRDRVTKMWRANGLTCFQVANGNF